MKIHVKKVKKITLFFLMVLCVSHKVLAVAPPESFAELAKKVKPSVVNIATSKAVTVRQSNPWTMDPLFRQMMPQAPTSKKTQSSLGTGFIIDADGDVLTNNHVIEGADEIVVKFDDGREIEAKIVGRDEKLDLAVIRMTKSGAYPALPLGDSDAIDVGDWVVAVGNPFGLGHTVTAGIVSAKARVLGAGPYDDFIQTDASINPGNSGGPLFNIKGEVIGINSAIIASGQGLGFAIPINMAKEVLSQLITKGAVTRGWLGVSIGDVPPNLQAQAGLTGDAGAYVAEVIPGGPASSGGVISGDIILEINGEKLAHSHELPTKVARLKPGEKATLLVLHDGQKYSKTVTVGVLDKNGGASIGAGGAPAGKGGMGLTLRDLTPSEKSGYQSQGVLVTGVDSGSQADVLGITRGDLIVEINGQPVVTLEQVRQALASITSGRIVRVGLIRGNVMYYFAFKKD